MVGIQHENDDRKRTAWVYIVSWKLIEQHGNSNVGRKVNVGIERNCRSDRRLRNNLVIIQRSEGIKFWPQHGPLTTSNTP